MSRAHNPPDTLTKEDRKTIGEVRRDIWVEGFYGMAVGSVSCLLLHSALVFAGRRRSLPFTLDRNTAMATFLGGGAAGAFVLSTTKGKNIVHLLHPIFERGKKTDSREDEEIDRTFEKSLKVRKDPAHDLSERDANRLYRRKTLQNSFSREGGLSDSHGGHWPKDDKTS